MCSRVIDFIVMVIYGMFLYVVFGCFQNDGPRAKRKRDKKYKTIKRSYTVTKRFYCDAVERVFFPHTINNCSLQ